MEIYAPLIENKVTALNNKMEITCKPFQILGFDLLLDCNLKAWLLEVNDHPSLNIYFDNNPSPMETGHMTDADICEVDLFVKSRLVKDTILLAKKKKETVIALN